MRRRGPKHLSTPERGRHPALYFVAPAWLLAVMLSAECAAKALNQYWVARQQRIAAEVQQIIFDQQFGPDHLERLRRK